MSYRDQGVATSPKLSPEQLKLNMMSMITPNPQPETKYSPVSYQTEQLCNLSLSADHVCHEGYKKHKKSLRREKKKKAGYKDLKKAMRKASFLATQVAKVHDQCEKEVLDVLIKWRDHGTEPEVGFYGLAWKITKCRKAAEQMFRAARHEVYLKVEVDTAAATAPDLANVAEADRADDEAGGEGGNVLGGVTTALATNTGPITGPSTQTQSSNTPPQTRDSFLYSYIFEHAAIRHEALWADRNLLTIPVVDHLRDLFYRSMFAYEFVQKLELRQMIFFWRKKKFGLKELSESLRENIKYFGKYEEIAVEAPGLALRIAQWGKDYEKDVYTVLATSSGLRIQIRYDILCRVSEMCRVEVKKLLKEAKEVEAVVREKVTVPKKKEEEEEEEEEETIPVVVEQATVLKKNGVTTLPMEKAGEKVRAKKARVPTYEVIVIKKRRGAQLSKQIGVTGIPGDSQGSEATSAAHTLVDDGPAGVANN
ncbi:hypothetical protein MMC30_002607 [Trapelia coarctata]|nr:hypothetical protein [Trapelia coarctata]